MAIDSVKVLLQEWSCKPDQVLLLKALNALAADVNTLIVLHNLVLTKLDADAGVTDTNYNALYGVTGAVSSLVSAAQPQQSRP